MATDQHRIVLNKTNTVSKFEENRSKLSLVHQICGKSILEKMDFKIFAAFAFLNEFIFS